eukprot:855189_1
MTASVKNVHVPIVPCVIFVIITIRTLLYTAPYTLDKERMQSVLQSVPSISIPAAHLLGYNPNIITNNEVNEPYHDPPPFCDLSHNDTNIVYYNSFPDNLTMEQLIAKRSEPVDNIPMCPNADVENYNEYLDILSQLPPNLIAYTNRCQINAMVIHCEQICRHKLDSSMCINHGALSYINDRSNG